MEETGLRAGQWKEIGRAHLSNSVSDEEAIFFLATELEQGTAEPEATELFAHKRVPFTKAVDMVITGEITDSVSVLAIFHYYAILTGKQTRE